MQRDPSPHRGDESIVARPGETHIIRGDTHVVRTDGGTLRKDAARTSDESDPAEIRADIEQTRGEMTQTIDAIKDRLDPEHLKVQALDMVRDASDHVKDAVRDATIGRAEQFLGDAEDTVKGAGYSIMDAIKQNPIPAALVGVGLGWLFFNSRTQAKHRRRRSRGYDVTHDDAYLSEAERVARLQSRRRLYNDYGVVTESGYQRAGDDSGQLGDRASDLAGRAGDLAERAGDTAGDLAGRAGDLAGRAGDTAGDLAGRAGEALGDMTDEARYRTRQAQDTFQQQLLDNPFAVGAIALGVGAAVALAAPRTGAEDQLMGETRDHLMDQAQSLMQDVPSRVQQVIDETGQTLQENAREGIQQAGQMADQRMHQAGDTARSSVQQAGVATQQAGSAMQQAGKTVEREAGNRSSSDQGSGNPSARRDRGGQSAGTDWSQNQDPPAL